MSFTAYPTDHESVGSLPVVRQHEGSLGSSVPELNRTLLLPDSKPLGTSRDASAMGRRAGVHTPERSAGNADLPVSHRRTSACLSPTVFHVLLAWPVIPGD